MENDIKQIRNEYNLSKAELARYLGVTNAAVDSWERRGVTPRAGIQRKLKTMPKDFSAESDNNAYSPSDLSLKSAIDRAKTSISSVLGLTPESVDIKIELHPL